MEGIGVVLKDTVLVTGEGGGGGLWVKVNV